MNLVESWVAQNMTRSSHAFRMARAWHDFPKKEEKVLEHYSPGIADGKDKLYVKDLHIYKRILLDTLVHSNRYLLHWFLYDQVAFGNVLPLDPCKVSWIKTMSSKIPKLFIHVATTEYCVAIVVLNIQELHDVTLHGYVQFYFPHTNLSTFRIICHLHSLWVKVGIN